MKRYRLKQLNIEGFRIYSEKKTINFFNNITVIYGRNGRGKTTLQDALSWLFNNDIVRYSPYNREWSRVKKTHTRSLIFPELPTSINALFEEIRTKTIETVTRNENQFFSPKDLECWFEENQRNDVLWANSLSQSKLQELAIAKGRERLENLAPLLDLTAINNEVKVIEDFIKDKKEEINSKTAALSKISEKDYSWMLDKVKEYARLLEKDLFGIINVVKLPISNKSVYEEINNWEKWYKSNFDEINKTQSSLQAKINIIKDKYFELDIVPLTENIKEFKNKNTLEKDLYTMLMEKKNSERLIEELEGNRRLIGKDLAYIKEFFRELKNKEDQIHSYNINLSNLKNKLSKHEILNDKAELIQSEIDKDNKKLEKTLKIRIQLLEEKSFIEEKYKEFLSVQGNIHKLLNLLEEDQSWLNSNSLQENEKNIEKLELRLKRIGGSKEALAKQKLELEDSINVLNTYINDHNCPLCGSEHESPEELRDKVASKKEYWEGILFNLGDEIEDIIQEITEARKFRSLRELKDRGIKDNTVKLNQLKKNKESLITSMNTVFIKYSCKRAYYSRHCFLF